MNSENYSLESSVEKGFQNLNETFTQCVQDFEEKVRSTPLTAVAIAAAGGYLLHVLPIGPLIRLILKLVLFSIKPLIVAFGAVKLYEFIRKQTSENRSYGYGEKDREPLLDSPSGPPAS
jgi:hypothetical protein